MLLASRLNLEAVLQVLAEAAGLQLQIVCAGTNEAPALEDTYLAGRICAALPGERTDAALIAEAVARSYETPFEALAASVDARAERGRSRGRHRPLRARVKTPGSSARAERV